MTFGGSPFGESTFGGTALAGSTSVPPGGGTPTVVVPYVVEIKGVRVPIRTNSLRIDFQLGRQGAASFELANLETIPEVGHPIRILYFSELLFAGSVDRIEIQSEPSQSVNVVLCECVDHSYLLYRRKIKIAFTDHTVSAIVLAVISSELSDDGVTMGVMDADPTIPIAECNGSSIYEFFNGLAVAVGCVLTVDRFKIVHFRSATLDISGPPLTTDRIESCRIVLDRETYRNRQTTTVTGTAPDGQQPVTVTLSRYNSEQATQRFLIEGTSGVYSDRIELTHPSSNSAADLTRTANAYNKIWLALAGHIRRTLFIQTRTQGYRAGQLVTVDFPHLGVAGSWIVQRVSMWEEKGLFMRSELELTQSSLLIRSQELWVALAQKGTVSVFPPTSTYNNGFQDDTPGTRTWTVPAGVTEVQATCHGGGAGGGGGARSEWPNYGGVNTADGARGGNGGAAIRVLAVMPGEVLTYYVGSGGSGGSATDLFQSMADAVGGPGGNGQDSWLERNGNWRVVQAAGGEGGRGGLTNARLQRSKTYPPGADGYGTYGDVITLGGAANGAIGGIGQLPENGFAGGNGRVILEW